MWCVWLFCNCSSCAKVCRSQCGVTLGKPILLRSFFMMRRRFVGVIVLPLICVDGKAGVFARYWYFLKRLLSMCAVVLCS